MSFRSRHRLTIGTKGPVAPISRSHWGRSKAPLKPLSIAALALLFPRLHQNAKCLGTRALPLLDPCLWQPVLAAGAVLLWYGAWQPNTAAPEITWLSRVHPVLTPPSSQGKDSNISYQLFVWEAFPICLQMKMWRTGFISSDSWVMKCFPHLEYYIKPSGRTKIENKLRKRER